MTAPPDWMAIASTLGERLSKETYIERKYEAVCNALQSAYAAGAARSATTKPEGK